jgi:hypothetical protein
VDWIYVAEDRDNGNELSGSIKGGKILDWLSDYQLLKKVCVHGVGWLVGWLVG